MAKKIAFGNHGPRLRSGSLLYSGTKTAKISDMDKLDKADLDWMVTYIIFLKASGHHRRYISEMLGISKGLVGQILDDEKVMEKVRIVQADMVSGAMENIRLHQIEMVEIIAEVARRDPEGVVRLRAAESILDRGGNTKVNKSEKTIKTDESDKSMFEKMFESMAGAELEVQQRAVELFTELETLMEKPKEEAKNE